jgi:hypothetical protein
LNFICSLFFINGWKLQGTFPISLNGKLIKRFEGQNTGYLQLSDIGKVPCSFHPFIKKSEQIKFKLLKSQDVYNTSYILNKYKTKIKIAEGVYYKSNIQKNSVTKEEGFSHKINLAYKKYQIISIKEKHNKIRITIWKRVIKVISIGVKYCRRYKVKLRLTKIWCEVIWKC